MQILRFMVPGLILLSLISFLVVLWGRIPAPSPATVSVQTIVQESMKGVEGRRFNKEGQLTQILTMQAGWHNKGELVTHMAAPYLKIIQPNGTFWDISASMGESVQSAIGGKYQELQLTGNVIIQQIIAQESAKNDFWWKLKTQHILFIEKNSLALSEDPVVIESPGSETHAIGIRAYLDRRYIELLNNVNTYYATS
jgi:LPS export ABC transporter protein LptC